MTGADQTDAVEALAVCGDPTCRYAEHCCYPDYGLCGVRRIDRADRAAAAAVPTSPHSPTSRGDQPTMTHHTTDQTDAVEALTALIVRTINGQLWAWEDVIAAIVAAGWLPPAEVARRVDEALAEVEHRIEADVKGPGVSYSAWGAGYNDGNRDGLRQAAKTVDSYREEVRRGTD